MPSVKTEEKEIDAEVIAPVKPHCPRCKSGATYELDAVKGRYAGHKCASCFHSWNERE